MRRFFRPSFRHRLFGAFLAVSLVPLLVCSMMLLQIFRLRMTASADQAAQESLNTLLSALDMVLEDFGEAAGQLRENRVVTDALTGEGWDDTQVYSELFTAAAGVRDYAGFDLYDREGNWRYSTQQPPRRRKLSTDWGVLHAAAGPGEEIRFLAGEDASDTALPLLQGAVRLIGPEGDTAGYLVIQMYYADFYRLLEGKYGSQNDLVVLGRYWRPVYCAQPGLAASLAPVLRARLLEGQSLAGASEDFLYSVAEHPATGLHLVLQRPQVFTRDTTRLIYTISLGCALVCILISVVMSLKLSGQMFRPIQHLSQGIDQVEHNNLDVQVQQQRGDELGELAERFNGMVVALKRNQEELVENQRELNEAQIRMLQAQLNPHFLCNTLDTMKWISKINSVPQVALMSTNLADILRFCISPDEFVPLYREVEILERYIEIQKIRLSGAFTFSVEVPIELEDCLVPKMILQPIVENAILHGLEGIKEGCIRVTAEEEDAMLRITVEDNGKGLPPELTGPYAGRPRDTSRGHLGLYNVDTILRKYYGEASGLYLKNRPAGGGAIITAALPLRREEETEC